jgi:hypothetical protein
MGSDLDPDSFLDPKSIFSSFFNIHFTFVYPSCKFVRLHIMT